MMLSSDPNAFASTIQALRLLRSLDVDTAAVRDKLEHLEHEWALVTRQLNGFERPVAPYLGMGAVEWVEPAEGLYRQRLLEEQERLAAEIDFWSMAVRHLLK